MSVKNNSFKKNNISFKEKAKAIYDLIRPELPLAGGICVITGQIIVLHTLPTLFIGVMGFLTGFFISSAAMVTNDYFDIEVDRINHPQRPLASGKVTTTELLIITFLFSITGFITAGLLGLVTLIFAIIVWIIAISYNWKLKEYGLIGNIMVGFSVASFFIFGGASVGGLTNGLIWIFGVLAFIFDLGEEIAADAMDMVGDKKRSAKTLPLLYGKQNALRISISLFFLFIAISFIPIAMGWLNKLYSLIFIPMNISIIYLSLKLYKSRTSEEGRNIIRQLYIILTIFIISFVIISIL